MSAEIISALKAMKLHGMASNYPEVAAQARHTEFSPEAFLGQLLRAEQAERTVRSMAYQMGAARFPAHRDLCCRSQQCTVNCEQRKKDLHNRSTFIFHY